MTKVVILIPGIMGSVLSRNGDVIWPGPIESLFLPFARMQDLLDPNLVASDVIRSYAISEQYGSLIRDLETCGFREQDETLVVSPYDWRKDIALAAEVIARHVETAARRHGPAVEIVLLAHSMGGLASRHYLESGLFKNRSGFANVRMLVTMGTPHRGAAVVTRLVLGYERLLFLAPDQVKLAVSDPRYPSSYQLLPVPSEPAAWTDASGTRLESMDIYDPATSGALGLVAANLDKAKAFWATLNLAMKPQHVRYFCFAGTHQATGTRVLLRKSGATSLRPDVVTEDSGGDGTVPGWSGFLPDVQRQFVGGEHGTIYRSRALRSSLAALLGVPGTLAAVPDGVDVAIRDRVVSPGTNVRVVIDFPRTITDFSGVLTIERAILDADGNVTDFAPAGAPMPASYRGVGLDMMTLEVTAPSLPGAYRIAFRDTVDSKPSGSDELIVQLSTSP